MHFAIGNRYELMPFEVGYAKKTRFHSWRGDRASMCTGDDEFPVLKCSGGVPLLFVEDNSDNDGSYSQRRAD